MDWNLEESIICKSYSMNDKEVKEALLAFNVAKEELGDGPYPNRIRLFSSANSLLHTIRVVEGLPETRDFYAKSNNVMLSALKSKLFWACVGSTIPVVLFYYAFRLWNH